MTDKLYGLSGVSAKWSEYGRFTTAGDAIKMLRKHGAASMATEKGLITIWTDDNGTYRGDLKVYEKTLEQFEGNNITDLATWVAAMKVRIK